MHKKKLQMMKEKIRMHPIESLYGFTLMNPTDALKVVTTKFSLIFFRVLLVVLFCTLPSMRSLSGTNFNKSG